MKKVLSFVLVLAMILGSVSLAFAAEFTDTKGTKYDEAARLLSDLGVISGKTSTTFAPNDNVTRAEFVAMVVRALGFGQQPAAVTPFTEDVPASYWASGYIKVANELGITFGKTATKFAPKDNITNDEMIAMVIRALGYKVEYLQGSFPSAQINQALALDIMEGIPTGSAPAIRGDVAQLIYNALGEPVISYDGNGNVIMVAGVAAGTTLAQRCGAVPFNFGNEFVVTGEESSAMNLKPYIGQLVTAYAGKAGTASEGKIIAIEEVVSEFVTDEIDTAAATWAALAAGDKIGDYTIKANAIADTTYATPDPDDFVYFENGVAADLAGITAGLAGDDTDPVVDGDTYTFAVKLSGNYITKIYSANKWVATAAKQVDADDLETLADDELLGEEFTLTNKDVRDENSYEILGVDKPEDIKADNVVAVYSAKDKIVRIEVGTQTVTGTVSRVNSATKTVTVGGTAYKLSGLLTDTDASGAIEAAEIEGDAVAAGSKGTFCLDYAGKIYSFEEEASTALYAVVLDENAGAPGLNGATPKVKLFTEEGKKVTYVAVDDLVTYPAAVWNSGIAANDVITFTLNSNGQVNKITKVFSFNPAGGAPGPAMNPQDVTKSGTVAGEVLTGTSVLFGYDGANFSVVKRADVLDKSTTDYQSNVNASNVVKVAVLQGLAGSDKVFYAFTKWDYIDNDDYGYEVFFLRDDGKEVTQKKKRGRKKIRKTKRRD